jgi:hypothetical protein
VTGPRGEPNAAAPSVSHGSLRLSVVVPAGWTVEERSDEHVRFVAPPARGYEAYTPSLRISLDSFEGDGAGPESGPPDGTPSAPPDDLGHDALAVHGEAALARLRAQLDGFALVAVEHLELLGGVPVHAIWFTWAPAPGVGFTQLEALVPRDDGRRYRIEAATLSPLADADVPVFRRVVRSIRLLPRR